MIWNQLSQLRLVDRHSYHDTRLLNGLVDLADGVDEAGVSV